MPEQYLIGEKRWQPSLEITGATAQICARKLPIAPVDNKKSTAGRNNLLPKCARGNTSQRYNKLQKFLHLL